MIVKERICAQNCINNHLQAVRVYMHHMLYLSVSRFYKKKTAIISPF